jgi:hypothetical protein
LQKLRHNWDGEDARPPAPAVLDSVAELLRQSRKIGRAAPSRISVTEDGTMMVEWQSPGMIATVEVSNPNEGEWLISRAGYPAEFRIERWLRPSSNSNLIASTELQTF